MHSRKGRVAGRCWTLTTLAVALAVLLPTVHTLVVDVPCCSEYPHTDAMFGAELDDAGISGKVSVVEPNSGCSDSFPTDDLNGSIAIIPRGVCSFGQKVFYAQMSSASAVIIFNNDGDNLIAMSAEERYAESIIIPAVFVGESTGINMLKLLQDEPEVIVTINKTDSKLGPSGLPQLDSKLTLIMFEGVTIMWCLIFTCYIISCMRKCCKVDERQRALNNLQSKTYYRHVSTGSSDDDDGDEADGSEYRRMVEDIYDDVDVDKEKAVSTSKQKCSRKNKPKKQASSSSAFDIDNCVICLEDFSNGDRLTVLPCGHEFHKQCISPWLLKRSSLCPICKVSAVGKLEGEGDSEDDGDSDSVGEDGDIEAGSTADDSSLLTPLRDDDPGADDNSQMQASGSRICCIFDTIDHFARMGTIVAIGMILTGVLVMIVFVQLTGE